MKFFKKKITIREPSIECQMTSSPVFIGELLTRQFQTLRRQPNDWTGDLTCSPREICEKMMFKMRRKFFERSSPSSNPKILTLFSLTLDCLQRDFFVIIFADGELHKFFKFRKSLAFLASHCISCNSRRINWPAEILLNETWRIVRKFSDAKKVEKSRNFSASWRYSVIVTCDNEMTKMKLINKMSKLDHNESQHTVIISVQCILYFIE